MREHVDCRSPTDSLPLDLQNAVCIEVVSQPPGRAMLPAALLGLGCPQAHARVQGREASLAILWLEWSASRSLSAVTIICYWRAEGGYESFQKVFSECNRK